MTPAARISAAIEVLDAVLACDSAERVLTTWGRTHRFAGSGDRAAIRDHVFDALRRLRSAAALGGAMTGRGVMLGLLRARGVAVETLFDGSLHGPSRLSAEEHAAGRSPDPLEALDCPAWLAPALQDSLGPRFEPVLAALQERAPLFLRANFRKTDLPGAQAALLDEGIATRACDLSPSALEVIDNPRRVQTGPAYRTGLVEIQDAASQAVADAIPLSPGARVLDLCAGGGGKTLAMAGRCAAQYHAHDVDAGRMADLPARAARAGVKVTTVAPGAAAKHAPFDVVLVDAPCSGSGAWRRSPQGKWRLGPRDLARLTDLQAGILRDAARLVAPDGALVYVTCSLLKAENQERVERFLRRDPDWKMAQARVLSPLDGGDGFFFCILLRS